MEREGWGPHMRQLLSALTPCHESWKWVSSGGPSPSLLSVITLIVSQGEIGDPTGLEGSQRQPGAAPCGSTPSRGDSIRAGARLNADSDVLGRLAVLQPEASQSPDSRALPLWLQQLAKGTENISQKATLPKYGNQAEGTNSLCHVSSLFHSPASASAPGADQEGSPGQCQEEPTLPHLYSRWG